MIKPIKYFIEAIFVYFFFLIAKIIGLTLSRKFFSFLFKKVGPIIRANNTINKNLMRLPNSLTEQEKNKIINNMWSNYGMTFIEYIFLNHFRHQNSHVDIVGEKILDNVIKKNKPVIFISGHFANYELMSMEITKRKIDLATIYRPLNNFFLNPFMEYLRKKHVCKNQIKKGINGVRETINYIKKKHSIALMIDQRVSEGKMINFFNRAALTTTLPAQLAIKFDLEIIPVFIERTKTNRFMIEFQNEVQSKNFKDKIELTKELNKILEKMIIRNPNQWIWTHNRWK